MGDLDVQFEFWRRLVLVKLLHPFFLRKGRQNARYGPPFCNTQTRLCKTSDATDDYDGEN